MSEVAPRVAGPISGTIDKGSPVPFYYQLRQLLERAVADGVLAPGEQIPTEASLCERYDVSRTVVFSRPSTYMRERTPMRRFSWRSKS